MESNNKKENNEKTKDTEKKEEKPKEKKDESKNLKIEQKLNNTESSFILSSTKILQNGDDMDIINELINLCTQLSLSSDQIGDNPNMPKLLEEICKNLEKLYIPEIII